MNLIQRLKLNFYETFVDLFKDFDIEVLADKSMTKEELKNELEKFYPIEKQKQYNVLGIRVELNI
jgi:ASC-1-like (ASCH) protein